ncbi:hypothetical protein EDD85DRAFT_961570 [Armillaria nabsnona]|nr:hypothetical protein EDD85DRAFT_961570 [Armillaria nabsnona]
MISLPFPPLPILFSPLPPPSTLLSHLIPGALLRGDASPRLGFVPPSSSGLTTMTMLASHYHCHRSFLKRGSVLRDWARKRDLGFSNNWFRSILERRAAGYLIRERLGQMRQGLVVAYAWVVEREMGQPPSAHLSFAYTLFTQVETALGPTTPTPMGRTNAWLIGKAVPSPRRDD